mmetsp:Transcript_1705/g.2638  ORF Transcript_1705/g.2638 Transcript_1705/m.2638 type:complete len:252 (+) Transcript_1705:72-827(+)
MQQRRRAPNSASSPVLPVTTTDSAMNGKRKHREDHSFCGPKFWSIMVLVVMAMLVVFCIQQFTSNSPADTMNPQYSSERGLKPLPLSQFPTLNQALEQSEMVALYFAASWCPMSTGPTNLLGDIFGGTDILTPQGGSSKSKLSIVYVSSDKTAESMQDYMKPHWIGVQYESDERTALKKHFSVCAKRELEELRMDRKYEIPSLFIFDGESHGLISTHGVGDIKDHQGLEVLEHWKRLQRVVRGLSEKYIEE